MDLRKHYKILEIDPASSLEQTRQAYRDLIAVWHPDRYTHNPRLQKKALEKVKAINAAFEIVSRFLIEKESGADSLPEANSRPVRPASRGSGERVDCSDKQSVWDKTEARLAALARAKKLARVREAARTRLAVEKEAAEETAGKLSVEGCLRAENLARVREKEKTQQARLEKELARQKAWAETEQKLRALKLAREKADQAKTGNLDKPKEGRKPFGWYVKQVLICTGILLAAFSGNALQTFVHVNFEVMLAMIAGGLLTWLVTVKLKRSPRRKK